MGRKICLTQFVCHSHFRGSTRSQALESSKVLFGGEINLKVDGLGNHLSVQMPIDAPFPTCHLLPCLKIFCVAIMLLQAKEGRDPNATQGSHYPRNNELLKLYGPVMTYLFEVATLVWLKVQD